MIQEVRKSIHFSPYIPSVGRKKDEEPAPTVSVDGVKGRISFGAKTLKKLGMIDKFVCFYYEPTRKIIGWRVRDKLDVGQLYGKNEKWKLVKTFGKGTGFWITGVKGIVEEFKGFKRDGNYKKLEVLKYIETASILDKNEVTYFVEVAEKKTQKELV